MKILVIGATGMIGTRIVAEALGRGHQITAASRTGQTETTPTDPTLTAVTLDASTPSAVAEHAAGHDAVISAISPPRDGSDPTAALLTTYRSLLEGLRIAGVSRLIAVGGAGSLQTESGQDLVDTPDFPAPDGTSFISAEDYAAALVDQLDSDGPLRCRMTVAY